MDLSLYTAVFLASSSPIALIEPPQPPEVPPSGAAVEATAPPPPEDAPAPQSAEDAAADTAETQPLPSNTIIVTGDLPAPSGDPLVKLNETTFAVTQKVDEAVVGPVAKVYEKDLPSPIRKGLRNFFRNLLEPVAFLNYLLQLKPGKAMETLGRFALNTTVGIGGLVDVAKKEPFNLPYRRNGFGNTLGYYGVGPGPFLVLPLVGATSLRDFLGGLADVSVLPTVVGKPFDSLVYAVPAYTVNSLEFRIEFDEKLTQIRDSVDPYTAMREVYLCQREADIAALKNRPPPRDCSVDALMADPVPPAGTAPVEAADSGVAGDVVPGEPIAPEITTPPAPPATIYVSHPVVQPIPGN